MHLRFSQDLQTLLERLQDKPLTLGAILAETAERGFSLAVLLLTFPFLLPMPPGVAGVFGAACALLGLQMFWGRQTPWLPKALAEVSFPSGLVRPLLNLLYKFSRIFEKICRPRLRGLTDRPFFWRINGLCIAWLSLLLMLPIPLTNPIPTIGILLLAIATLESDGVLMFISYGFTLVVSALFISIGYGLYLVPQLMEQLGN